MVVDSGATEHMARIRDWFSTFTPLKGKKVRQGEGYLEVESIGDIQLPWTYTDRTERTVRLRNVYYVPRLFMNLIYISKVKQNGGYFDGRTDTFRRIDTDAKLGTARLYNGFELLNFCGIIQTAAFATSLSWKNIWHQRLGHASMTSMKLTAAEIEGIKPDSDYTSINMFETCHVVKAYVLFPKSLSQLLETPSN
jgi:hypothetical protein